MVVVVYVHKTGNCPTNQCRSFVCPLDRLWQPRKRRIIHSFYLFTLRNTNKRQEIWYYSRTFRDFFLFLCLCGKNRFLKTWQIFFLSVLKTLNLWLFDQSVGRGEYVCSSKYDLRWHEVQVRLSPSWLSSSTTLLFLSHQESSCPTNLIPY